MADIWDSFSFPGYVLSPERANTSERACFQFAIKHEPDALLALETKFWEVSLPLHPDYGKFLDIHAITAIVDTQTLRNRRTLVTDWINNGLTRQDFLQPIESNKNGDFVRFCTSVGAAEKLFGCFFGKFINAENEASYDVLRPAGPPTLIPDYIVKAVDFIGGLNTPVHLNRAFIKRKLNNELMARRLKEIPTYVSPNSLPDRNRAAPRITFVTAGNTDICIGFELHCQDGKMNTDKDMPCVNAPGGSVFFFQIVVKDAENEVRMLTFPIDICGAGKGREDGRNRDPDSPAYCSALIPNVRQYIKLQVSVHTIFRDGFQATSPWSTPVVMTDFATVPFLRELYDIPIGLRVQNQSSTQAVVEFFEQYYSEADLQTYLKMMGLYPQPVAQVLGVNNETEGSVCGDEAQLDIQVMMGVAPGSPTTFWSVAGRDSFTQEPFLQWMYELSEMKDPPLVQSVSYADPEDFMPKSYTDRLNIEFIKAGLRGVSILAASGDWGSSSIMPVTAMEPGACDRGRPLFPASSPYVMSVGATQLTTTAVPIAIKPYKGVKIGPLKGEKPCSSDAGGLITSGGGFSDRYDRPTFQNYLQEDYIARTRVPKTWYNSKGRGYPDIATYGNKFVVIMNGSVEPNSGSSASAPLMGAMITLWNDIRLRAGKAPLGYMLPFLYQVAETFPEAFSDVVLGEINCSTEQYRCCSQGFEAIEGWDAASGLGSPNFRIIARISELDPLKAFPQKGQIAARITNPYLVEPADPSLVHQPPAVRAPAAVPDPPPVPVTVVQQKKKPLFTQDVGAPVKTYDFSPLEVKALKALLATPLGQEADALIVPGAGSSWLLTGALPAMVFLVLGILVGRFWRPQNKYGRSRSMMSGDYGTIA
eukprot:gb/GEZN01001780.1/.p1 GENE.gb/GEZN01001780.1/~~gb/GEZN01001780.1/.p1  ORF type:complete len:901 (-),score=99.60 gb/GEZN01001780.1/:130-2748(-)